MNRTFTSVDDTVLKNVIQQAQRRLVFIAPGVRMPVAQALVNTMDVLPAEAIHLVLDVDARSADWVTAIRICRDSSIYRVAHRNMV